MSGVPKSESDARPHGASEKSAAWSTAFFFLAEHLRDITDGALNHKKLYALVSSKGRFINHSNPTVRKRTAGTLSRIIHTRRYMQDMRDAYCDDVGTFDHAAGRVCAEIREAQHDDGFDLVNWLIEKCWPDVRRGLVSEAGEWRDELDLFRLDYEMSMLFDYCRKGAVGDALNGVFPAGGTRSAGYSGEADVAAMLLSAMLYAIAFGHLDVGWSRAFIDGHQRGGSPFEERIEGALLQDNLLRSAEGASMPVRACLVRFTDSTRARLSGFWAISEEEVFAIGRYTDCQAIELSREVSRIHCRILYKDGAWLLEDAGSRNGCRVHRDGARLRVTSDEDAEHVLSLQFGDDIELPGGSTYAFTSTCDHAQLFVLKEPFGMYGPSFKTTTHVGRAD